MDPLHSMHEYAWEHVLYVADSRDKKALSESCSLFSYLLQPEECAWTFDDILPFLWRYLKNAGDQRNSITLEHILNLRQVCNAWRESIDHHLAAHPEDDAARKVHSKYELRSLRLYNEFEEELAPLPRSPFVGRGATLLFTSFQAILCDGQQECFRAAMSHKPFEVLNQFGSHLWNVHLDQSHWGKIEQVDLYQLLRRLMILLPNVRRLAISLTEDISMKSLWPVENPEQSAFISQNPLPELPHLEVMKGSFAPPILEKYAPQLKYLYVDYAIDLTPTVIERLRNLVELDMWMVDPSMVVDQFRTLQSPLEKLFMFFGESESILWPVDEFLTSVEHLCHLKRLEIQITTQSPVIAERNPILPLVVRNESILHVDLNVRTPGDPKIFWNFLLALPNLQTVSLLLRSRNWNLSPHPLGFPDLVQVNQHFFGNMYDSNIWEMIPSLQTFDVDVMDGSYFQPRIQFHRIFRRQEYEEMRLRQGE